MSAAARAEARKQAIRNRGADRLAKLTTSARGEDAPAYLHDGERPNRGTSAQGLYYFSDPPLAAIPSTGTRNFLGEESSDMPSMRSRTTHSPSPGPQPARGATNQPPRGNVFENLAQNAPDPSVWSPEQQQDFIKALMNASSGGSLPQLPSGDSAMHSDPAMTPMDNPFAALLGSQLGGGTGENAFPPFGPGMGLKGAMPGMTMEPPKEKTRLQKILPLLHLVAMWCLLAYFVLWVEPNVRQGVTGEEVAWNAAGLWRRWADLGQRSPLLETAMVTFKVHVVVGILTKCVCGHPTDLYL